MLSNNKINKPIKYSNFHSAKKKQSAYEYFRISLEVVQISVVTVKKAIDRFGWTDVSSDEKKYPYNLYNLSSELFCLLFQLKVD